MSELEVRATFSVIVVLTFCLFSKFLYLSNIESVNY